MTHGSLFSGIGGFDLAAQWMGWENLFHVERDPFCRQVLSHHFPESQSFDDVKEFDATPFRGRVRIISGGFPCQPFSAAGKRAGTSDDRYLWPEMFRIIREARPTFVVAENVRGLISWNDGLVLDTVCTDLEGEGYEVFPVVLPAASVNAPHRRDRIWIVATNAQSGGVCRDSRELCQAQRRPNNELHAQSVEHGATRSADASNPNGQERQRRGSAGERKRQEAEQRRHAIQCAAARPCEESDASNAERIGFEGGRNRENSVCKETRRGSAEIHSLNRYASNANGAGTRQNHREGESGQPNETRPATDWQDFPTVPPVCGGDDGLPERLDGITFPKWRRESIKAYGNAIVPQVAFQIFQALEDLDRRTA